MLSHDRYEELASLAAIGELSRQEHEEFEQHKTTCARCREAVSETRSVAAAAFLAGSANEPSKEAETRHDRLRENLANRLPNVVPVSVVRRHSRLLAAGVAAAFLIGAGVGTAVGSRTSARVNAKPTVSVPLEANTVAAVPSKQDDSARLERALADLQKQTDTARRQNQELQNRLTTSDERTVTLEARLGDLESQAKSQSKELQDARNDLNAARGALTQSQTTISAHEATINTLKFKLADREARLTEVTATVEREREMLANGREVRDLMGARDLHIVDIVDRNGKGRRSKAFGRAFYTEGKSLVFYAFDLPTKNTADGKFVYAAWGSNSNEQNGKIAHSMGIFYNDDQTQHRWAMKFDDPKLLQEIDTVFVTLEPADSRFIVPTGKAVLEAYFGTPPNHP